MVHALSHKKSWDSVYVRLNNSSQRIEITGKKVGGSLRTLTNTDSVSTTKVKVSLSNPSDYPKTWKNWITWVDEDGVDVTDVTSVIGDTTTRESMTLSPTNIGLKYFDTDLVKYVLWNGTAWTNLDGTTLS